ncbi:hypothetical protein DIPPA_25496 [Diplonema papillatum]|nr:hypothetical protein DIPPA_25496 [Diplonema papillatum]
MPTTPLDLRALQWRARHDTGVWSMLKRAACAAAAATGSGGEPPLSDMVAEALAEDVIQRADQDAAVLQLLLQAAVAAEQAAASAKASCVVSKKPKKKSTNGAGPRRAHGASPRQRHEKHAAADAEVEQALSEALGIVGPSSLGSLQRRHPPGPRDCDAESLQSTDTAAPLPIIPLRDSRDRVQKSPAARGTHTTHARTKQPPTRTPQNPAPEQAPNGPPMTPFSSTGSTKSDLLKAAYDGGALTPSAYANAVAHLTQPPQQRYPKAISTPPASTRPRPVESPAAVSPSAAARGARGGYPPVESPSSPYDLSEALGRRPSLLAPGPNPLVSPMSLPRPAGEHDASAPTIRPLPSLRSRQPATETGSSDLVHTTLHRRVDSPVSSPRPVVPVQPLPSFEARPRVESPVALLRKAGAGARPRVESPVSSPRPVVGGAPPAEPRPSFDARGRMESPVALLRKASAANGNGCDPSHPHALSSPPPGAGDASCSFPPRAPAEVGGSLPLPKPRPASPLPLQQQQQQQQQQQAADGLSSAANPPGGRFGGPASGGMPPLSPRSPDPLLSPTEHRRALSASPPPFPARPNEYADFSRPPQGAY